MPPGASLSAQQPWYRQPHAQGTARLPLGAGGCGSLGRLGVAVVALPWGREREVRGDVLTARTNALLRRQGGDGSGGVTDTGLVS